MLERKNIVQREVGDVRSAEEPYSLTKRGRQLEGILKDLAAWGLETLELPTKYEVYSPLWSLLEFQIRFKPEQAKNLNMMFELRIENETHHIEISNGALKTHVGPAPSPLFVITTDAATFILILRGLLSFREAIQLRRVEIEGSLAALSRTLDMLGLQGTRLEQSRPDEGSPNIEMYPAR